MRGVCPPVLSSRASTCGSVSSQDAGLCQGTSQDCTCLCIIQVDHVQHATSSARVVPWPVGPKAVSCGSSTDRMLQEGQGAQVHWMWLRLWAALTFSSSTQGTPRLSLTAWSSNLNTCRTNPELCMHSIVPVVHAVAPDHHCHSTAA